MLFRMAYAKKSTRSEQIKSVVRIQAAVRGFLVRAKLNKIRTRFQDIFDSLENNDTADSVTFPQQRVLCYPRFGAAISDVIIESGSKLTPRSSTPSIFEESREIQNDVKLNSKKVEDEVTPVSSSNSDEILDELIERKNSLLEASPEEEPTRDDEPSEYAGVEVTNACGTPTKDETSLNLTVDASLWEVSSVGANREEDAMKTADILPNASETRKLQLSDDEICSKADDAEALKSLRENICLEILWIQQAIDSRKNYLKLRTKMDSELCTS